MLTLITTFFNRREALQMWKQRLGSEATYQKLIDVFERASYHTYAEIVRNIVCNTESETDDSHDDDPVSQPATYPPLKPSPLSSTKCSQRKLSTCDEYLLVNPAIAQRLPKRKKCSAKRMFLVSSLCMKCFIF